MTQQKVARLPALCIEGVRRIAVDFCDLRRETDGKYPTIQLSYNAEMV
jgi:hypothetical protein